MDSNQSTGPPDSGHRNKQALSPPIVQNSNITTLSREDSDNHSDSLSDDDEELHIPPSDVILKLAEHVISKKGKDSNVVFSPLSINVVLALVAAGTDGGTLEELLSYLKADSLEALNSYFARLISTVFADGETINSGNNVGPVILFSNSVWLNEGSRLKNSFKQIVEADYRTTLDIVDFRKPEEVAKQVNSWVVEHTRGLIKEILPPDAVEPDDGAILVNATYFKGEWVEKFDKSLTKDGDFHRLGGNIIQVPFMSSTHIRKYCLCGRGGLKVLGLPYKCGGETNYFDMYERKRGFTMYFILPDSNMGLPDLVQTMGKEPGFLESHTSNTPEYILGNVRIPKFKFLTELEASNILKNKLGLRKIFDKNGLIRGMIENDYPLYVSEVIHKACVEVNEDGVKAAAVTASKKKAGCGRGYKPPQVVDFVADHPFMFVIREENTKAILFIGQVNNP